MLELQFDAPLWVKGGSILIGLGIAYVTVLIARRRERDLHTEASKQHGVPSATHLSQAA
jgi:hypothetical protein